MHGIEINIIMIILYNMQVYNSMLYQITIMYISAFLCWFQNYNIV